MPGAHAVAGAPTPSQHAGGVWSAWCLRLGSGLMAGRRERDVVSRGVACPRGRRRSAATGTVKFFNITKGFGFITPSEAGQPDGVLCMSRCDVHEAAPFLPAVCAGAYYPWVACAGGTTGYACAHARWAFAPHACACVARCRVCVAAPSRRSVTDSPAWGCPVLLTYRICMLAQCLCTRVLAQCLCIRVLAVFVHQSAIKTDGFRFLKDGETVRPNPLPLPPPCV